MEQDGLARANANGDLLLSAIACALVFVNSCRVAVVFLFDRFAGQKLERTRSYWRFVLWAGNVFSVIQASLAIRAFKVGDVLAISIVSVVVGGYITGAIIHASAVPRLASPQIFAVFGPMILAAMLAPNKMLLATAVLLSLF